jgi:hypothetical protein
MIARQNSRRTAGVSGQCLPVGEIKALADQGLGSFDRAYHCHRLATHNSHVGTFAQRPTFVGDA